MYTKKSDNTDMHEQDLIYFPSEQADSLGLPCQMLAHEAVEQGFSNVAAMRLAHEDAQKAIYDYDYGMTFNVIERRNHALNAFNVLLAQNVLIVRGLEGKLAEILGQEALVFLAEQKS